MVSTSLLKHITTKPISFLPQISELAVIHKEVTQTDTMWQSADVAAGEKDRGRSKQTDILRRGRRRYRQAKRKDFCCTAAFSTILGCPVRVWLLKCTVTSNKDTNTLFRTCAAAHAHTAKKNAVWKSNSVSNSAILKSVHQWVWACVRSAYLLLSCCLRCRCLANAYQAPEYDNSSIHRLHKLMHTHNLKISKCGMVWWTYYEFFECMKPPPAPSSQFHLEDLIHADDCEYKQS